MISDEFSWRTTDGLKLYGYTWAPDNDIKAVICLVHGMGEHIHRYDDFAPYFVEHKIAVIGYDQRGHGRSEGKRGHTPGFDHLLYGIDDLLDKAGELYPEIPQFLMGHSMGGGLVLNYAINYRPEVHGVIASSPWLKLAFEPPAWQEKLGKIVGNLFPGFQQSTKLDANDISQLPEQVEAYKNDPLVHDKITAGMYFGLQDNFALTLEEAGKLQLPVLLYHGTGDRITSYKASEAFAQKGGEQVSLKLIEGAFHETHHDKDRDTVLTMVKDWIEALI